MSERPVLVLHDAADADAGQPWRTALAGVGWPGRVLAPDLPGHGQAPAPCGGVYESVDTATHVLPLLDELEGVSPVVVGVGVHGWPAQILALGGRATALVLVDGLGGPWEDAVAVVARGRRRLRAIAEDPSAIAPPPPSGLDPRLQHGVPGQSSLAFARRAAAAVPVPVLVIESPRSHVSAKDRRGLVGCFGEATLVELPGFDPGAVADATIRWARRSGNY